MTERRNRFQNGTETLKIKAEQTFLKLWRIIAVRFK